MTERQMMMKAPTFKAKIGDHVSGVSNWSYPENSRYSGVVIGFECRNEILTIRRDEDSQVCRIWNDSHLQLMPRNERFIIAVEQDGKFAPARKPREYTTIEQATLVAERMAEKHGGEFFILKAVKKVSVRKTVVTNTVDL